MGGTLIFILAIIVAVIYYIYAVKTVKPDREPSILGVYKNVINYLSTLVPSILNLFK